MSRDAPLVVISLDISPATTVRRLRLFRLASKTSKTSLEVDLVLRQTIDYYAACPGLLLYSREGRGRGQS